MERHWSDAFVRRQVASLLALALSGCAGVGYSPGARRRRRPHQQRDRDRRRAASCAARSKRRELDPNQRIATPGYPDGAPLLAIAARAAALEVMRFLISAGADLNGRTPVGETPLMLAAFFFDESAAWAARLRAPRAGRAAARRAPAPTSRTCRTTTPRSRTRPTRATSASCASCSSAARTSTPVRRAAAPTSTRR